MSSCQLIASCVLTLGLATACADAETDAEGGAAAGGPLRGAFDVLLVTLDTCRADRLGSYGNERIRTPVLDALAAEGTRFENAFTPIPSTLPSHCSMLTGLYPARHGVHDNGLYELDARARTLTEVLSEAGYATGAFLSAFVLDSQFGLDQSFDVYDDTLDMPYDDRERPADDEHATERQRWLVQMTLPFQRRAESVTRSAIDWLQGLDAEQPAFVWVHCFDVHGPYQPPPPWDSAYDPDYDGPMDGDPRTFWDVHGRSGPAAAARDIEHMIARYDGELSYTDEALGTLFEALRESGRWDRTLVLVVADHGEGFGEHQQIWDHNAQVHDEVVRVPLLVRHPAGVGAGEVRRGLVRTLDLAPTVLDCLELEPFDAVDGRSLLGMLQSADAPAPGEILLEAKRDEQIYPVGHSFLGLRTNEHKLILRLDADDVPQKTLLFDLESDPGESRSRSEQQARLAQKMTDKLLGLHRSLKDSALDAPRRTLDELTSEGLDALGYVGGR